MTPMIYYATEFKQYSGEMLATVVALACFQYGRTRLQRMRDVFLLGIMGALLFWLSHSVVFVLAPVGILLLVGAVKENSRRKVIQVVMLGAVWLISLTIVFRLSLSDISQNQILLDFWSGAFPPSIQQPQALLLWLQRRGLMLFEVAGFALPGLALVIVLAGGVSLARHDLLGILSLAFPFVFTLIAAAFRLYPFGTRLLLFLAPILFILLGIGLDVIIELLKPRKLAFFGYLLIAMLLYHPLVEGLSNWRSPDMGEHIAPAIAYIAENWTAEDGIYVYYASLAAFRYYEPQYLTMPHTVFEGVQARRQPDMYLKQIDEIALKYDRVWFVFSHVHTQGGLNEQSLIINYLESIGAEEIADFRSPGASVSLFDLSATVSPGIRE